MRHYLIQALFMTEILGMIILDLEH